MHERKTPGFIGWADKTATIKVAAGFYMEVGEHCLNEVDGPVGMIERYDGPADPMDIGKLVRKVSSVRCKKSPKPIAPPAPDFAGGFFTGQNYGGEKYDIPHETYVSDHEMHGNNGPWA